MIAEKHHKILKMSEWHAQILMDTMIVAVNKVDLLPEAQREEKIAKMKAGLMKVFSGLAPRSNVRSLCRARPPKAGH